MSTAGAPDLARQLLAVGTDVAKLRVEMRDIAAAAAGLPELHAAVDALDARVEDLADSLAATRPKLWDWTSMTRTEAHQAWATLVDWVSRVLAKQYARVGSSGRANVATFPDCWYLHPDLVAELSWLCQEWLRLYAGGGTPAGAGDWHDRWLPGALARVRHSTAHACDNVHNAETTARGLANIRAVDDADVLAQHIESDLGRRPDGNS